MAPASDLEFLRREAQHTDMDQDMVQMLMRVLNMEGLTYRQKKILLWIAYQIMTTGSPPTIREIGRRFEIRSPNGVMCHLHLLRNKGKIALKGFHACGISLPGIKWLPVPTQRFECVTKEIYPDA